MNTSVLLFLNIGGQETMLILVAVLLLFGGKKLPELARGLGKGIREFKDATDDVKNEIHKNINAVQDDLNKEIESVKKDTEVDVTPPANNYTEGSAHNTELADNSTEVTETNNTNSAVTTDEKQLNSN